jgi:dUTP pyrophosphatase
MNQLSVCYLRDAARLYGSGLAYATPDAAGMDLRACMDDETLTIAPGERVSIPTGICIEPHEPDVAGFVYSRSGLGAVKGLTVAQGVGVIDADYRGELIVWLLNTSQDLRIITRGDRIAQLVFQPVCHMVPRSVETLSATERGNGGFGHTGNS